MCTALSIKVNDHYFGRNLDYEHDFGEKIVITPRNYEFNFKNGEMLKRHYAIIGMGVLLNNYPLYFDATNEKGLSMAALNFLDDACYFESRENKENITSYELISWILSKCTTCLEAKGMIKNLNITNDSFTDAMPPSKLHWIISDKNNSLTIEQTKNGLNIYDNPFGVLTNSPSFNVHLENYEKHSFDFIKNAQGKLKIPGDWSSESRFVKMSFLKNNVVFEDCENETISSFFHMLYSVYFINGVKKAPNGYKTTNYTSCCNSDKCIYYYTTYDNLCVKSVSLFNEDLDIKEIIAYEK